MASPQPRDVVRSARRLVIKIGSSTLTTAEKVNTPRVERLVEEMAALLADGRELIVVTSGARAAGLSRLGLSRIPSRIPEQQAAAAVGQIGLMALYQRCFAEHGVNVGQVLLTAADVENRTRYLNARHTLEHLLAHRIVPIVNENDSVAVEELKFGDNDRLSALVAGLVGADLLVMLTDVDGLYDGDPSEPGSRILSLVETVDDEVMRAGGAGGAGHLGTGGMTSKLLAARSAARRGIPTVIANGGSDGVLARVVEPASETGTLVVASSSPLSRRKHWIVHGMPVRGALVVDAGAAAAVARGGKSLLPSGLLEVRGSFDAGDCVDLVGPGGEALARGLVAYDARDCELIRGRRSSQVSEILGYHGGDEVVHRDDLVLLDDLETGAAE